MINLKWRQRKLGRIKKGQNMLKMASNLIRARYLLLRSINEKFRKILVKKSGLTDFYDSNRGLLAHV